MNVSEQIGVSGSELGALRAAAPKDSPDPRAAQGLPATVAAIVAAHRPSNKPFFARLASLPGNIARDPRMLGELYLVYQAAMHATRAAVYYLPHLDSPALRQRKLQIFIDDDGLANGDTHHYQLTRAFQNIGAICPLRDEDFGGPDELAPHLDSQTAAFVRLARTLYGRSLGPWCIVETMSDDWMRALANALTIHFPEMAREPYFADCFDQGVEERHAQEAVAVTQLVLERRPEYLAATIEDAKTMAEAFDGVWAAMDAILTAAVERHEVDT